MKPWMFALVFGRRPQLVTVTFTSSAVWPAPAGLTVIDSAVGKGAPGSPGSPDAQSWSAVYDTIFYRKDGTQELSSSSGNGLGPIPGPSGCDPYQPLPGSDIYNGFVSCVAYSDTSGGGSSPTTGASATGFGRTFPGGLGGAAPPTAYSNVPVTPGTSYSITVPSGGSITITYYI